MPMLPTTARASCFVSYSSKDQRFAERLARDLIAEGFECFFAPDALPIGANTRTALDEAIASHSTLVLVLSKDAVRSGWVEKEVLAALEREAKIRDLEFLLPIRVDDAVMKVERGWAADLRRSRNIGDFTNCTKPTEYARAFERLVSDMGRAIDRQWVREEQGIISAYFKRKDFPETMYSDGVWKPNHCFTSLPKAAKAAMSASLKPQSRPSLDRVDRDIQLVKGLNADGQPHLLFYFSGKQHSGWQSWLLPSSQRAFENSISERLRNHARSLSTFLGLPETPRTIRVRYAPSSSVSVVVKTNRFAASSALHIPKVYVFRFCFVTGITAADSLLAQTSSFRSGRYRRRFRWFHPEGLEEERRMWDCNADVIQTLHRTFGTMLSSVPDSLGSQRLLF
jgi:hypothetical protein